MNILIIKKGQTRKVYVFKLFVIKVALIHWRSAYKNIIGWWKRDKRKALKIIGELFWGDYYNADFHPKANLFAGIHANLSEFIFYLRYRPAFCKPTYFTFLGLINIQKKGYVCEMPFEKFKARMHLITNNEIPFQDHTFDSPNNFTCDNNHLQCIDYADSRIHKIIQNYGNKLFIDFFND